MLRHVDRYIWRIVDGCLLVAVLAMVVAIGVQVISRVLNHSEPWTEELSRFLFIWTAFLGMATGFRTGEHPRVDVFVMMLPARVYRSLRFLTPVCALIFFGIAGWYGSTLLLQQLNFGETSPAMGIGMWIVTLPIVIGSLLSIVGAFVAAFLEQEEADPSAGVAEEALSTEGTR